MIRRPRRPTLFPYTTLFRSRELALGGTAVGTGLNRHVDLTGKMLRHIEQRTGIAFYEAKNHFEAQGGKDAVVEASGQLKTIATSLFKIANDIRLLGSGPRCGIGEIQLPATQPGSSIMPGKVNPVMCESMMMVCAQVFGNDAAITWAGANGNFELNVMMPVMAHDLLESIRLLANVVDVFCEKCVTGIAANKSRCEELVELSMAMVTSLAPKIGYDRAAELAKESVRTGKTVRELCREKKILPEKELPLLAAANGTMEKVSDVGDAAQMFTGGRESGFASRMLMLYVAKGNTFLTVGLAGFGDDTVALEKAKTVAQKLLEHL